MKVGLVSLTGHFILPLATSVVIAINAPEAIDWLVLAMWTALFALYQYYIDVFIMRDKLPTTEYYEFSLYVVSYSILNTFNII